MLLRNGYIGIRLPKRKLHNLQICKNLLLVAAAPIPAPPRNPAAGSPTAAMAREAAEGGMTASPVIPVSGTGAEDVRS